MALILAIRTHPIIRGPKSSVFYNIFLISVLLEHFK